MLTVALKQPANDMVQEEILKTIASFQTVPVDPQKDQLQATVANLEKERLVLEGRLRIQQVIRETLGGLPVDASQPKKKRPV